MCKATGQGLRHILQSQKAWGPEAPSLLQALAKAAGRPSQPRSAGPLSNFP